MKEEKFLLLTVVEDPHNGKTHFELKEGEELDVGQIEDFTLQQIIELGLETNSAPLFLYWLDFELKVSERRTRKFDSLSSLNDFIRNKCIYCSWIKRHREHGNIVMAFHEMPDNFDKGINDLLNAVTLSIFNLMNFLKPKDAIIGDTKKLTIDIVNTIKNYPYEKYKSNPNKGIADILTEYENEILC